MKTREEIVNTLLSPVDGALGSALWGLERIGVLKPASEVVYKAVTSAMLAQYKLMNELDIEGLENVPNEGGVLLACNHQSWLDAQVLAAAAPRQVHFMAKSEFENWPVLRHLVKLSGSIFVRRGGDERALETVGEALRNGWAVGIFPEGTIPGEEDIPRRAVDPKTGLLQGRTGVARLALDANVPIVPVGVSGTGRAFPPEIYPRLEVLRMPGNTPVRIRFGKPISIAEYANRKRDRNLFREITDHVMGEISALVDHRCNYAPIEVPIPEPPRREAIGVLLLHGFTSAVETVNGLVPYLEEAKIPYEMPVLRGHGTRYQDLRGVTAREWYVDAECALMRLWNHVDRIVVVGLSMGGLVALELGMRHPDKIAGVVTVAAALKFADPLAGASKYLAKAVRYWPAQNSFNDLSLKVNCRNYPKFPTDAFVSLYEYSKEIANRLRELHVPVRILQSKKDQIVAPEAANIIYEKVSSPLREIIWYEKSGHEMMQDMEAEQVFDDVLEFVHRFELQPKKTAKKAATQSLLS